MTAVTSASHAFHRNVVIRFGGIRASMRQLCSGRLILAAVLLLAAAGICCTDARALQAQHGDGCNKRLLWFMATTSTSSMEYWHYGKQLHRAVL